MPQFLSLRKLNKSFTGYWSEIFYWSVIHKTTEIHILLTARDVAMASQVITVETET